MKIIALLEGIVNKKNLIKLLSGILFCAAITTSPTLAAENTSNTIGELNSLIDVLKSDNIENVTDTVSNPIVDNDSEEEEEEESVETYGVKGPVPLTLFGVWAYGTNYGDMYYDEGGNIPRSNLPLVCAADQYGNGNITYVSIDGRALSTSQYDYERDILETGSNRVVTKWRYIITFSESVIEKLPNGKHTVKFVCSPARGMASQVGTQQVDSFSFNLVD